MAGLFDAFPSMADDAILIRKMTEQDVDALAEITGNEKVYRYIPSFLYRKSRGNLLAAIRNVGGRDFERCRMIIAGVYRTAEPDRLVGLAEIFDYKKRENAVTIGYRINERFWHQGIAGRIVALLREYLLEEVGVSVIRAFVMPENVYSARALLHGGFQKEERLVSGENWGGRGTVQLEAYTCRK